MELPAKGDIPNMQTNLKNPMDIFQEIINPGEIFTMPDEDKSKTEINKETEIDNETVIILR